MFKLEDSYDQQWTARKLIDPTNKGTFSRDIVELSSIKVEALTAILIRFQIRAFYKYEIWAWVF